MYNRAPRRRGNRGVRSFMFLFIAAALAVFAWYGYMQFIPNGDLVDPGYKSEYPIFVKGKEAEQGALIENNEVKLPLASLQQVLGEDKPIRYEPDSGSIIFTTANKVLRLKTDSLEGTINQKPYNLTITAETSNDTVYIPAAPLKELYGLQVEFVQDSGIVTILSAGDTIQLAEIMPEKGTAMRIRPTIRAPFIENAAQTMTVRIWEEQDGWLLVQSTSGLVGYINKKDVRLTTIDQVPEPAREPAFVAWKVMGNKINMTWEAVYERKIDTSKIGSMQGVNVVSPTWFELADDKGTIKGKADPAYVKWAHQQGMQIWALFSNAFEPDRTTKALASAETRFSMIQQLIGFAEVYNLQGINIDFENVHTADKDNFVQFVRELTPLLHEQGLVVSIDVTPKSNSEMWSLFLDRAVLGSVVDYMMVMAYDEHWASSPKSGSVASLPWTEKSIVRIMKEDGVPASKLMLSMPLYTRIWTEKKGDDGKVTVTSKAVGMDHVKAIIAEKKLKPVLDAEAGQNYVEYTEDGALNRIWIEDDLSMKARVALVRKYDLAGVATWQRGFQTASIWKTIDDAIKIRP
ncbi:glycosyl hydrolase family 18 protein [Paenibacillus alkaliterrae]|uniref:glycosyl hydrolase family 18 protein n=1 Tax=Paenibacillus alkaliterrae TaxID=320909 RepID=UPI001F1B13A6|nr:glycosyl hydrolase family 18 protein [Paenibacillus alkaliterrae]MCF2939080.1 glycosyl hydrolase family 18 protein [Paenibacillus alkaliterrae]